MDSDTLNTASGYLNNLLQARGLLRNGKAMDFAKPTRDTRAQIINLVHDLLLRRDRDQEDREHIATTLRTLRSNDARKDGELERLRSRVEEKERSLLQAQTEARSVKVEMKKLDSSAKTLQEQLVRLKTSVGHIKTQCANDVRKRDMHIERLKTHLQGQQRGNKGSVIAPILNIIGGSGSSGRGGQSWTASVHDLQDPEYTLKQETNEFLTQLGQSLSDENDGLIAMLTGTLKSMKELLGLDSDSRDAENDTTMPFDANADVDASPMSYEVLAAELESTLEVLKTVLTSADFVSMEEVEARDDEIMRLREGWVHMEARWKEVLLMMNSWRMKMEKEGDTINLDDLKRGLGLGQGLDATQSTFATKLGNGKKIKIHEEATEDSAATARMDNGRDSGIGDQSSPSPVRPRESTKDRQRSALEPPELFSQRKPTRERQLQRISPNVQSPRKVAFVEDMAKSSPLLSKATCSNTSSVTKIHPTSMNSLSEHTDHVLPARRTRENSRSPERSIRSSPDREARCLFPDPSPDILAHTSAIFAEDEEQHQLTVQEKLRAIQLEAERAATEDMPAVESSQLELELDEEIKKLRSPAKKSRITGRPRRRKSTLSPEELGNLLGLE